VRALAALHVLPVGNGVHATRGGNELMQRAELDSARSSGELENEARLGAEPMSLAINVKLLSKL
jgi:hypothetical protein